MINKNINKFLIITIPIIIVITIFLLLYFVFDLSSKIDVLKHPEKYSFRMNFASFVVQNDYYLDAEYHNNINSIYRELKTNEKKYENKTDEISHKIYQLNNQALDLYHDLISLNIPSKKISNEDFAFLTKNCVPLENFFYIYLKTYPEIEDKSVLYKELKIRKEAISLVKKDLKDKKINATVTLDDIKYENLTPAYLPNSEPTFAKEFSQEYYNSFESIGKEVYKNIENELKNAKNNDEAILVQLDYANKFHSKYITWLDNLNIKWKHRYIISAIEYKNNNEDKIIHLYEIYPYKEGNRIYWNIQYHSPNSEFIKSYLKMIELLMNI